MRSLSHGYENAIELDLDHPEDSTAALQEQEQEQDNGNPPEVIEGRVKMPVDMTPYVDSDQVFRSALKTLQSATASAPVLSAKLKQRTDALAQMTKRLGNAHTALNNLREHCRGMADEGLDQLGFFRRIIEKHKESEKDLWATCHRLGEALTTVSGNWNRLVSLLREEGFSDDDLASFPALDLPVLPDVREDTDSIDAVKLAHLQKSWERCADRANSIVADAETSKIPTSVPQIPQIAEIDEKNSWGGPPPPRQPAAATYTYPASRYWDAADWNLYNGQGYYDGQQWSYADNGRDIQYNNLYNHNHEGRYNNNHEGRYNNNREGRYNNNHEGRYNHEHERRYQPYPVAPSYGRSERAEPPEPDRRQAKRRLEDRLGKPPRGDSYRPSAHRAESSSAHRADVR
jgi:hypothetical protein